MQARLIVKNFGPIEYVDLDLRNVNVFIGPQASGKSALAKIYTICKSPLSFLDDGTNKNLGGLNGKPSDTERFKKMLDDYNVGSFLNDDTYVFFSSELHDFIYSKNGIKYDRKMLGKIRELETWSKNLEENRSRINDVLLEMYDKLFFFKFGLMNLFRGKIYFDEKGITNYLSENKLTDNELNSSIKLLSDLENDLSSTLALYIPSERNFITIIKGAVLNLINNNVPIPKHILSFGAEFEKSAFEKQELDLSFLKKGLLYKFEDGTDKIYYSKNKSIKLTEAASGLQSIVPLLLPISSIRETIRVTHFSFVIEEPELNLFPKAQYELIKVLEKDRIEAYAGFEDMGTIHTYTTHSPYILSAFNNILFASKVRMNLVKKNINEEGWDNEYKDAVNKRETVLPVDIEPEYFSAYQICDGKAESIFNREKGLIEENYIDEVTDKMGDDFDALMELMEEA